MTTPTLLDAAREVLFAATGKRDPFTIRRRHLDALRVAIAREEERQEIIEGLVEATRETEGLPWPDMAQVWADSDVDEYNRAMFAFVQMSAALARYDAMKEDDRA